MDHHHGPITAILAAMTRLGEADARKIAVEASVAYSTTVKKLRGLAADGRAIRRDNGNGPVLWRAAHTDTTPTAPEPDRVDAERTTFPDTAPNPAPTVPNPDIEPAPESAPTRPNHDTSTYPAPASTTDETHAPPAVDEQADPGGGGPARTDQPDDAAVDAATPESGTEPAALEPLAPPADEAAVTDSATGSATGIVVAETGSGEADAASTAESAVADAPAAARRGKGKLRDEVLAVLQDHPDTAYKISQLSKLLGGASQGAITNALHKLVTDGTVTQTVERPATYQAN
jgi:hypothetical protein